MKVHLEKLCDLSNLAFFSIVLNTCRAHYWHDKSVKKFACAFYSKMVYLLTQRYKHSFVSVYERPVCVNDLGFYTISINIF